MSSNFFAMVERMKLIDRWALMNNTGKENIAEHSHTVAVIAHALALIGNKKFGRSYNAERRAAGAVPRHHRGDHRRYADPGKIL